MRCIFCVRTPSIPRRKEAHQGDAVVDGEEWGHVAVCLARADVLLGDGGVLERRVRFAVGIGGRNAFPHGPGRGQGSARGRSRSGWGRAARPHSRMERGLRPLRGNGIQFGPRHGTHSADRRRRDQLGGHPRHPRRRAARSGRRQPQRPPVLPRFRCRHAQRLRSRWSESGSVAVGFPAAQRHGHGSSARAPLHHRLGK